MDRFGKIIDSHIRPATQPGDDPGPPDDEFADLSSRYDSLSTEEAQRIKALRAGKDDATRIQALERAVVALDVAVLRANSALRSGERGVAEESIARAHRLSSQITQALRLLKTDWRARSHVVRPGLGPPTPLRVERNGETLNASYRPVVYETDG